METTELTVTIKAIKVDNKKMTITMFRQLPTVDNRTLFNDNGTLDSNIIIWGHVRYEFNDICHWLLFAHNGQLKKTALLRANAVEWAERDIRQYCEYMQAKVENRDPRLGYVIWSDLEDIDKNGNLADYALNLEVRLAHAKNEDAVIETLRNSQQLFISV